ncbi:MAG: DEAD/DEAH box helicase [Desulfobacterales bacterium]
MLATALERLGIRRLFGHQAEAIDALRNGRHVVVASPTASGKSLIFNLPVLESCLGTPDRHALYLFPLKALTQDQLASFVALKSHLPPEAPRIDAAIYDGDTSAWHRRKIRSAPPQVVMTNPDMLHHGFLAYHHQWSGFFQRLDWVVVDEVHTLRGLMGSHMTQVFRRLRRICAHYGASPQFVFCSATVANPVPLAETLSGLDVQPVSGKGGGRGQRHLVLLDPVDGLMPCVLRLLQAALRFELRTIVYTQSRKMTEWIGIRAREQSPENSRRLGIYRAGLMPGQRRDVEKSLASGELLAVVTTSALELGIDIGDLDLCILAGYPGTLVSTWQRAGRVGRNGQPSALAIVAGEDALDRYFLRHPGELVRRGAESAVVNPYNPKVLEQHLPCAAAELPLAMDEIDRMHPAERNVIRNLVERGLLLVNGAGSHLLPAGKNPHRGVELRGSGVLWRIRDIETGNIIGEIDGGRIFREAHPGAVYLHGGEPWRIDSLDHDRRIVSARPASRSYFTRPRGWKTTEILEVRASGKAAGTEVVFGAIRVTDQITGYEKLRANGRPFEVLSLDLPPQVFETEGFWIVIPDHVQEAVEKDGLHFMGGIHALEHAMIGVLPLLVLTDRNDLGGISMTFHPQVGGPAVFVYDGAAGGAGFSREAYERFTVLLEKTLHAIESCPCDTGCPSCVHSPKCGSGNRPIDKAAALFILRRLRHRNGAAGPRTPKIRVPVPVDFEANLQPIASPARYGVFDLETQRSAAEVGGWHLAHRMGMSCGVLYDSADRRFHPYTEDTVEELIEHLKKLDLVVGFNIRRFDFRVLKAYTPLNLQALPMLDLLDAVHYRLGYRLSLDHLAKETLGTAKAADGLIALQWWKEGRLEDLIQYCRNDVEITRNLYCFGRENGYLLFRSKAGASVRVQASWGPAWQPIMPSGPAAKPGPAAP